QGREAALLFAREGARVVVCDVNERAAADTARAIGRKGGKARGGGGGGGGGVGRESDVERMVDEGVRKFRALHVLYNNAGVLWKDRDRSVLETSSENWDRVQAINLKGPFFVAKHGIPHPTRACGGSIINIGSVSALAGFTVAQDSYTSAKGALISLTKSLAIQFAPRHARCNIIHP